MGRGDLSHIASAGERRTYEFSKLEYVLTVFVTTLQGAIYMGCGKEKRIIFVCTFGKVVDFLEREWIVWLFIQRLERSREEPHF